LGRKYGTKQNPKELLDWSVEIPENFVYQFESKANQFSLITLQTGDKAKVIYEITQKKL
jgi:hypothetical protein